MARPIKLIKKEKLEQLYDLYSIGVHIPRILRDEGIDVSYPHLHTLLKYYESLVNNREGENAYRIEKSLFPDWLDDSETDVGIQDVYANKYKGKMPLGEWL